LANTEDLSAQFPNAGKEDMGGRVILPGLTDAHLHLQHYALGLQKIDCETDNKEECLRRVAERLKEAKPGEWILGHGWNQNMWGNMANRPGAGCHRAEQPCLPDSQVPACRLGEYQSHAAGKHHRHRHPTRRTDRSSAM
jgi:hypothetical protein